MDEILSTTIGEDKKRSGLFKVLTPIFVVIFIIILVLVKRQNADFPIGYIILIGAVILVIGGIAFFGLEISDSFKRIQTRDARKKVLPEPVETKILWSYAMTSLTNPLYRDHIREYVQTINHSVGKNMKSLVVEFQVHTLYRPGQLCSILLNANYPKRTPTIIFNSNKKQYQLKSAVQSMSFDPEDPANEEETVVENAMTGTVSKTKRKTYASGKDGEKAEKKEALV